ncbi:hypothetical protein NUSPORA_02307 [Nucleospora cyclopteri]
MSQEEETEFYTEEELQPLLDQALASDKVKAAFVFQPGGICISNKQNYVKPHHGDFTQFIENADSCSSITFDQIVYVYLRSIDSDDSSPVNKIWCYASKETVPNLAENRETKAALAILLHEAGAFVVCQCIEADLRPVAFDLMNNCVTAMEE